MSITLYGIDFEIMILGLIIIYVDYICTYIKWNKITYKILSMCIA